ncbi:monocarboxylate transporter 14-like isoform X1 [Nematostella vectensis]|uniref:monocarboxylate transporter 14-like isoform X1 n=2 Tax=Nematostella vectensis TaxID=45351 RepID=UPI0020773E51|nr:monocarboxylate transporter 14-like isoform X1 [Nematostella vectensis]
MLPCNGNIQYRRQQDSCWSWFVCLSATLSVVIVAGLNMSFGVVMPVLLDQFKSTKQSTAWVGSLAQSLTFFAAPLTGLLVSRFDFRRTAMAGVIMCTVSVVVMSFTENIIQMFFAYSLPYGLGSCFVFISGVFVINKYFNKRHALALGIYNTGVNIGVLTLAPLCQVIIEKYGWRSMYRIMTAIVGLAFFLTLTFNPNAMSDEQKKEQVILEPNGTIISGFEEQRSVTDTDVALNKEMKFEEVELESMVEQEASDVEKPLTSCEMITTTLRTPAYMIATVTLFLEIFTSSVIFVHLVEYGSEVGISSQQGANLFIYIGICSLLFSIISGGILDIPSVNPFHINQVAAVTMGTSILLLPLATKYTHFAVFSAFFGAGLGAFFTTVVLLLMFTVKERLIIVAYPMGEMLISIGNAAGPPTIGFIADVYGSYRPAYYTAGSIMLLAAFIPFLQYCFKPWRHAKDDKLIKDGNICDQRIEA